MLKFRRLYQNTCAFLVMTGEDIEQEPWGLTFGSTLSTKPGIFQCRIGFGNTTILLDQESRGCRTCTGSPSSGFLRAT